MVGVERHCVALPTIKIGDFPADPVARQYDMKQVLSQLPAAKESDQSVVQV